MRSRTIGKIIIGVLIVLFAVLAVVYGLACNEPADAFKGLRALGFGLLALTAAVSYKYMED